MNRSEQHKLNRMLSGSAELSVQEKEAMLADLLGSESEHLSTARARSPRRYLWLGSAGAATAVALFSLVFGLLREPASRHESETFTARGSSEDGAFRFECIDKNGKKGVCKQGNTIVFGVVPPKNAGYFSVASLDEKGNLIRYFPSGTEKSLSISQIGLLKKGIVIGNEHHIGRYRVFGVFSESPLSVEMMRRVIETRVEKRRRVQGSLTVKEALLEVVGK